MTHEASDHIRRMWRLHTVDPSELSSLQDFSDWLEALLHNPCQIWDQDGEARVIEIRQMVARLDGLNIDVYPNDHQPPHFHVRSPNLNAAFAIEDCRLLSGTASGSDLRKVRHWHQFAKPLLLDAWATTRPTRVESRLEPRA